MDDHMIRCPRCRAWHTGEKCEPCERKKSTAETVSAARLKDKIKWWR